MAHDLDEAIKNSKKIKVRQIVVNGLKKIY